jgi:hypothetical protein
MVKRHAIGAFLSLAFLLLVVPAATCGEDNGFPPDGSFAACHVFVDVDPNIAIMPLGLVIDMGSIQTGVFTGTIPFRIDANTEKVRIWTAATKLWKGDVYGPDAEVAPIGFEFNSGVEIYAETGSPVGGADNRADFIGLHPIDGYPGYETERIVFESSQNGHFSQRVDMVVRWDQSDPEKPMGEYSGKVKMLAEVVLPAP